jgi:beta-mannosidase
MEKRKDHVKLWFPAGYGAQNLYSLKVDILQDDELLNTQRQTTGFRAVELVRESDSMGESFYFRINSIDIFCGGSCWIPADNLLPRLTPAKYREWLQLMIEGNQIMTRYVNYTYHASSSSSPSSPHAPSPFLVQSQ